MTTSPRDPDGGSGPDQPDRSWGASAGHLDPWDPDLLERLGLRVPSDARALDADRRAMLGLRERPRVRRLRGEGPRSRLLAASLTTCALAVVVVLTGSLIALLAPHAAVPQPGAYPLADSPASSPGQVGGLLPDAGVQIDNTIGTGARDLRPAVLFVPPQHGTCAKCAETLTTLWKQGREYGLPVYVVAPLGGSAQVRTLLADATDARPHVLVDSAGALTAAFRSDVAQAVLVHADGVIGGVLRDPAATARYEQLLSPLRFPGAPPSLRPAGDPA